MSLLKIRNLEVSYGPVSVIRGISLEVREGDKVTILGANGAGKTTILRTISGLLRPEKGTIEFRGERIDGKEPDEIVRMGISQVAEGREIFPDLTVRENLRMGAFIRKDKGGVQTDLEKVLGYFPVLKDRQNQRAGTLSGGEQQMLAISRAFMSSPKLMLLDEPSLGLAPFLVAEIFRIINRMNREGTTILFVEQNARVALEVAGYGYILEVGRVVLENTSRELMENEDVKEFYLGIKEAGVRGTRRWKRKKKWR
jgi:branched-chain amino acid transport system ATP-binding protein